MDVILYAINFEVNFAGYYSSEETTEADLVVFRVSMSLSASVVIGNNYFILVQVKSQFNDVWNHTFVITPKTYLVGLFSKSILCSVHQAYIFKNRTNVIGIFPTDNTFKVKLFFN